MSTQPRSLIRRGEWLVRLLPWLLLLGGAFAVGRYAPDLAMVAGASDVEVKRPPVIEHPWRADLIGQHVRLPDKDLWGRPIPRNRNLFVATVSCSSCGDPSRLIEQLRVSRLRPLVVVSDAFTPEYAKALRDADGIVAIETRAGDVVVPDGMLRHAPQIGLVDASGKIVAVPNSSTPLEEFLRSGGKEE